MAAVKLTASPSSRRKGWTIVAIVVGTAAVLAGLGGVFSPKTEVPAGGALAMVARAPMVIAITESGEIEAKNSMKVANDLNWAVVIRKVVPAGTLVKKGDLIIQFDCQDLTDAISTQQVTVDDADSNYTQAKENLELARKEGENNIRKSQQKLDDAVEALARYIECDGPISIKNAQGDVQVAQRDVVLAQVKLEFKLKVNKDPELNRPYSENEIKADQINVGKLQLALEKAQSQLEMLQKYEDRKQKRTLQGAIDDAKLDLEHDRVQAKTSVATAQAAERGRKRSLAKQNEVLDDLLGKQAKLTVKAAHEGLVVYMTGSNSRRNNSDIVIDVGEKINPNTLLMIVPDMATLRVRTKVYEAMIQKVKRGVKTFVRLDAKPGLTLNGQVGEVSVLPENPQWWQPDVKVFTVAIDLEKQIPDLKPGMTAQVEMVLAQLPADTLSIPVAALFSEQDKHYCWRMRDSQTEKVPVTIGQTSADRVQIVSGLSENDTVRLAQPNDKQEGQKKEPANTATP